MIVHDLPEHDMEGGSTSQFARGAAGISNERGNFVCVGTSMGILHVFAIGEGNNATHHCTLEVNSNVHPTPSLTRCVSFRDTRVQLQLLPARWGR